MSVINEVGLFEFVGAALLKNIFERLVQVYTASNFSEILQRLKEQNRRSCDLAKLPPEVGVKVLKCLSATDLALASCVWSDLGADWSIWADLCRRTWRGLSLKGRRPKMGWRQLYMLLDEATVRFNAQPEWGLALLAEHDLLDCSNPAQIAHFIHGCESLNWSRVRQYLSSEYAVLEEMAKQRDWSNQFLPAALRSFFSMFHIPPLSQSDLLEESIAIFARQFHQDNAERCSIDAIQIMAYAIVLLSVDLSCNKNQIRNKMSKREFIKNTLRALENDECDLFRRECGDYYDNIYLCGHIAPDKWE